MLGVTESRVSQLHTKAILRLKARLSATRVRATRTSRRAATVERVRLALVVPGSVGQLDEAQAAPLVEAPGARVALEDPEAEAARAQPTWREARVTDPRPWSSGWT